MKLQFDPNQAFQLDAVASVTDLFDGQPQGAPEYAVIQLGEGLPLFMGQDRTELGVGNRLLVAEDKLRENLRAIQARNDIDVADPLASLEAWELFDLAATTARRCPHFSVEEEECGVTFGKVPLTALAKLSRVVDGVEQPIGREAAEVIRMSLVEQHVLDGDGHIQPAFDPKRKDFKLELPEEHRALTPAVVDLLAAYQIERHIRKERDEGGNRLKKEVTLSPEFRALWDRIKPKTTYRVEFETDVLVQRAVDGLKRMERIEQPRILKASGRLGELFNNPQRFMDAVASILKHELHRLLVDGIKYERIDGSGSEAEWEMLLFKDAELINYLTALKVDKSVYEQVVYDSEVEREFARRLDERDDIKLFVKLPGWFEIATPVGKYNPDWAILKHDGQALYLVRETKGTRDFLKLRTGEADKVRCGQKHFEALGVPLTFTFQLDAAKIQEYIELYYGKTIHITNRTAWSALDIIQAYRDQAIIETCIKDTKGMQHSLWWPMGHWTDQKIHVHGFYTFLALLLKSLVQKKLQDHGIRRSWHAVVSDLDEMYEVVDLVAEHGHLVPRLRLSTMTDHQEQLFRVLL